MNFISIEPVTALGTLVNIALLTAIGFLIVNHLRKGKDKDKENKE